MNAYLQPPVLASLWLRVDDFEHCATSCVGRNAQHQAIGETRWCCRCNDSAWVAWPWAGIADGLVVLADPLDIASNLILIRSAGVPVRRVERTAALVRLVTRLPWQAAALAAIRALEARLPNDPHS